MVENEVPMNRNVDLNPVDAEDEDYPSLENEDDIIFNPQKIREGYQRHTYMKKAQQEHDSVKDCILRMAAENKFWEKKFDKYYRKLSKLQQLYDGYMTALRTVLITP